MSIITSTEMYRNMKIVPSIDSSEYEAFALEEWKKVKDGIWINGIYISGWLYWHLNHWKIVKDDPDDINNKITGCPDLRDNEWMIAEGIERAEKEKLLLCIFGSRQIAKELADYEPVITENGYKCIGDTKVGDRVYGKNGKLCTITGVFPQGVKPIYRIHLKDGRFVDAGLEHLWEVYENGRKLIRTTKQLLESKLSYPHKKSGKSYRYKLPANDEVEFSKRNLNIHPYVLGALLGDGGTTTGTNVISSIDSEIINEFKKHLQEYELKPIYYTLNGKTQACAHTIVYRGKNKFRYNANPLNQELIRLGLKCKASEKFIPEDYKMSSVDDRYELLQGLMDTDGSITSEGAIEIKLASERLIDDIAWVCRSLGIRCQKGVLDKVGVEQSLPNGKTFTSEACYYRLYIRSDKDIFKLSRKKERLKKRTRTSNVSITEIEYLKDHSATCIQVDAEDALFLTKDFIVTHNTTFSSSYLARKGTIIEGSQNLIIGASKPDLTNITNDIDFGLQNVTPMFWLPRITRDWKSGEVALGIKSKEGDNKVYSTFRIRNTEGGKNTEVTAGARPSSALIDEAGKGEFAKVLAALLPGMRGIHGLRAPVLITGTGGDMEKSKDAENMFMSPDTNEIVAYVDEQTGRKTGLFMPGWLRSDFKKKSNLAEYLGKEDCPELEKIEMMVADKEKAISILQEERKKLVKDVDASKLLKAMMYYPLTVDEVFLSEDFNIFPKDLIIEQKQFLSRTAPPCDYVELYLDINNQVKHKFTDKRPIENYPMKPEDNKEGVIQIWEMPISDAPGSIYVAATDPYKVSQAAYSDSVGSTYIFKRTYDIVSDKFQNMIVAAYHGRPKKIQTWYDNTKLLLKFYNAKTLCENMDYGFIQHLIDKNEAPFYLVPQPQFLYDIHPNTTVNRNYGIHMTTEIKHYLYNCIIDYMTSTIRNEITDDGEVAEVLGVKRIIDPLLLDELLKFAPDKNCDRIISFGLVLAYAKSLDKTPVSSMKDTRYQELYNNTKRSRTPFMGAKFPFSLK